MIALFRRLFRGRTDVYPNRWESTSTGKSVYAPACANEWCTGICDKPRIKCGQCGNRLLKKLSDSVYKARASAAISLMRDLRGLRGRRSLSILPARCDWTRKLLLLQCLATMQECCVLPLPLARR
ncbi:TOTE conflict system archaeo-eukaryotic primase domain-containing protein [Massilia psychrophila]|uniref:TOTE conflict system archaeo-eukaryotic primase domain-containing protein n=1 Tax=Massilia psychrophila TaxID=1603353 RepID=UPI003F8BF8CD